MKEYLYHGQWVRLLKRAPFFKGVKRNCLIEFKDGTTMIVPWRALRKIINS